ncbi:hypothetical protein SLA2020_000520 [Shorea laevis]
MQRGLFWKIQLPKQSPAVLHLQLLLVTLLMPFLVTPGGCWVIKPPDVNFHAPPSTSNEKSWNLDKEDLPSPPAPRVAPPTHP